MSIHTITPWVYRDNAGAKSWFAVRVRSNYERLASAALHEREYEEFLPLYLQRRRQDGRNREVEKPLFPGYVFARFDPRYLSPILSVPGVVHIVGAGRTPLAIPESEIDALMTVANSRLDAEPCPYLRAGQFVMIVKGPLAGVEGCLLRVKSQWRLIVSVTILQRSVGVEVDYDWVKPVAHNAAA